MGILINQIIALIRSLKLSGLRILQQPRKNASGYKLLSILTVIIVFAITACNGSTTQLEKKQSSSMAVKLPVETQIVSHALGQVEIPLSPQRIIVLDDHNIIDPLLALSINPVGVISCAGCQERFPGIPDNLVGDIPDLGIRGQPSLEKILTLKPDLILAEESHKNSYKILSQIAPTVLIDPSDLYDFKERLRYLAQMLGKSDRAEEILAQYQKRIQQLQQKLGKQIETKTVSVIYPTGSAAVFYTSNPNFRTYGQILKDVGLQLIPIQQNQEEFELLSSIEVLPEHDADILFVLTDYLATEFREKNSTPLSFLKQPIWSQLKAVQSNQVYQVNWTAGGPIGANRIIDDLYKYLVSPS